MLALVDDAHWLDPPSAEALLFAIRRLLADPVAVVLAVREGQASLLDGADLPAQRVGGLDRQVSFELLRRGTGAALTGEIADHPHAATGGNPCPARGRPGGGEAHRHWAWPGGGVATDLRGVLAPHRTAPRAHPPVLVLAGRQRRRRAARAVARRRLDWARARRPRARRVRTRAPARWGREALAIPCPRGDLQRCLPEERRQWCTCSPVRPGPRRRPTRVAPGLSCHRPRRVRILSASQVAERARHRGAHATSAAASSAPRGLLRDAGLCDQPRTQQRTRRGWRARSTGCSAGRRGSGAARGRLAGPARAPAGRAARSPRTGDGGHAVLVAGARVAAEAGEPELGALMLADAATACFYAGAAPTMASTTASAPGAPPGRAQRARRVRLSDGARTRPGADRRRRTAPTRSVGRVFR